jgi:integrase
VLEPIWRDKPKTASRLRGRIEAVLDYASARGWRTGDNPARWRGHLANLLPAAGKLARVVHHSALPWQEIEAFLRALAKQQGVAALALRFTILTAARTGEAIGACWREFDMRGATWTVSADRMKAGREHRVPLSDAALSVLREAAKLRMTEDPLAYVFPGARLGKSLSSMATFMLLRRMQRADLTTHGFRSTFRDWAGETTAFPREVIEMALAHRLGDAAEQAYARGDLFEKRRRLMAEWAEFCSRSIAAEGDIVPNRGAR